MLNNIHPGEKLEKLYYFCLLALTKLAHNTRGVRTADADIRGPGSADFLADADGPRIRQTNTIADADHPRI